MMRNNKHFQSRGITLFISIVIMATLLLVAMGITSIAVKGSFLTAASRDSQFAFYAADTGIECAIYWDVKNTANGGEFSAFSGPSNIACNQFIIGVNGGFPFTLTFAPDPYCAVVTVTKSGNRTTIESKGYNTCDTSSPVRVERAVRVTY